MKAVTKGKKKGNQRVNINISFNIHGNTLSNGSSAALDRKSKTAVQTPRTHRVRPLHDSPQLHYKGLEIPTQLQHAKRKNRSNRNSLNFSQAEAQRQRLGQEDLMAKVYGEGKSSEPYFNTSKRSTANHSQVHSRAESALRLILQECKQANLSQQDLLAIAQKLSCIARQNKNTLAENSLYTYLYSDHRVHPTSKNTHLVSSRNLNSRLEYSSVSSKNPFRRCIHSANGNYQSNLNHKKHQQQTNLSAAYPNPFRKSKPTQKFVEMKEIGSSLFMETDSEGFDLDAYRGQSAYRDRMNEKQLLSEAMEGLMRDGAVKMAQSIDYEMVATSDSTREVRERLVKERKMLSALNSNEMKVNNSEMKDAITTKRETMAIKIQRWYRQIRTRRLIDMFICELKIFGSDRDLLMDKNPIFPADQNDKNDYQKIATFQEKSKEDDCFSQQSELSKSKVNEQEQLEQNSKSNSSYKFLPQKKETDDNGKEEALYAFEREAKSATFFNDRGPKQELIKLTTLLSIIKNNIESSSMSKTEKLIKIEQLLHEKEESSFRDIDERTITVFTNKFSGIEDQRFSINERSLEDESFIKYEHGSELGHSQQDGKEQDRKNLQELEANEGSYSDSDLSIHSSPSISNLQNQDFMISIESIQQVLRLRKRTLENQQQKLLSRLVLEVEAGELSETAYERKKMNLEAHFSKELKQLLELKKSFLENFRKVCREAQKEIQDRNKTREMIKCLSQEELFKSIRKSTKSPFNTIHSETVMLMKNANTKFGICEKKMSKQIAEQIESSSEGIGGRSQEQKLDKESVYPFSLLQIKQGDPKISFGLGEPIEDASFEDLISASGKQQFEEGEFEQPNNEQLPDLRRRLKQFSGKDKEDIFEFVFLDLILEIQFEQTENSRIWSFLRQAIDHSLKMSKIPRGINTSLSFVKQFIGKISELIYESRFAIRRKCIVSCARYTLRP